MVVIAQQTVLRRSGFQNPFFAETLLEKELLKRRRIPDRDDKK
jgi:hypothetical protein